MSVKYAPIPRIEGPVTAESFYGSYVARRLPVVLSSQSVCALDAPWGVTRWRDLDYLDTAIGDLGVQVEQRESSKASFGTGTMDRVVMPMKTLLQYLKDGDTRYYLNTQYEDNLLPETTTGPDTAPSLSPLLSNLKADFPSKPKIIGHLELHQTNIWLGATEHGSTSGLHHDFHDNLYCLVKGRKRFTLFPPQSAASMYTIGQIGQIHANGLINYRHFATRPDGASLTDVANWYIEKSRMRMSSGRKTTEALDQAEKDLAKAQELLASQHQIDKRDGDNSKETTVDHKRKRKRTDTGNFEARCKRAKSVEAGEPSSLPPSFCKVTYELIHQQERKSSSRSRLDDLERKFPLFGEAKGFQCLLGPGDFLYLPASWFHEVTSFPDEGTEGVGVHLALNFWLHPPSQLHSFDHPYEDDFWTEQAASQPK